jgi:hypothetical protein
MNCSLLVIKFFLYTILPGCLVGEMSMKTGQQHLEISNFQIITNDTIKAAKDLCYSRYGKRDYLPPERSHIPPLLYSFPGSGNTWCRLLIEYATGIYSGSIYTDGILIKQLPGEIYCSQNLSIIKAHPTTLDFHRIVKKTFGSARNKCEVGKINLFQSFFALV